ncbi:hypothetical protein ACFQBQ_06750 [Granulicella cerasi]|uniref:NHL repeat containing protein n=1 Tax=Granulicella cerasi TaxID=741063 RepID=A0ABW1Z7V7_9BACT|nr:hypothetical protein [Granulicella cerasi]
MNRFRTYSLLSSSLAALMLSGCGMGTSNLLSNTQATTTTAKLQGKIFGGQQPVFNASIVMMQAGNTGYGTGATSIMNSGATVYSAADGSFNLTGKYTCPTTGSNQVYLVATGGDPTGQASTSINNTASVMVAALGPCSVLNANTVIQVNEVTTVGAAFALGQFVGNFGAAGVQIGAPTSNQVGLTNAFATAHNLVNTSTGNAAPQTADTGTNFFMTAIDQRKLYTMANILASCVNQTSAAASNCTTLFSGVAPTYAPSYFPNNTQTAATLPTDTFQAAAYMSLNSTSTNATASSTNLGNLFNLQSAFMPYSYSLSVAPVDWTLALNYSGNGINYLSSAAVDGNGDVWFSNANATGGVVVINGGTGVAGGTAGVTGGVIGFYSTGSYNGTTVTANGTRQVAIDQNNKAWFPNYTAGSDGRFYLLRAVAGAGVDATLQIPAGPTLPYAVAVDAANTVFATTASTQIVSASATAATGTSATSTSGLESGGAASIAITPSNVGYAPTNGSTSVKYFSTTGLTSTGTATTTGFANYGSAVDGNGYVWIANHATSNPALGYLNGSALTSASTSSCMNNPTMLAIDGNNNVWVTNGTQTTTTANGSAVTIGTVCEFSNNGTLISSAVGYGSHNIGSGRGIAIDQSGNVWVTSYATASSFVTQIIGAAAPAVAPLAVAVKNNTFGRRP